MSSNNPIDFGLIIVTYNSAGEIAACLKSLPAAAGNAIAQICLIDNNSADDTCKQARDVATQWPQNLSIKVIANRENIGFTKALNQGLKALKAHYYVFLNPDTVLPQSSLTALAAKLEQQPNAGIIAPQLQFPDGKIQPSCRRFPLRRDVLFATAGLSALFPESPVFSRWQMGDFDHRSSRQVDQPQGAFLMAPQQVVQQVGPWDERFFMFFSDVDWCKRVMNAGFDVYYCVDVPVLHHKGVSIKANRPRMILSSHRAFIQYFWKHFNGAGSFFPNTLVTVLLLLTAAGRYVFAWLSALATQSGVASEP